MIAPPYPYKNFHFQIDATPAELRRRIEARLASGLQWDEGRESLVGEVDDSGFLLKSILVKRRQPGLCVVRGTFEHHRDGTRVHVQITVQVPAYCLWGPPLLLGALAWMSLVGQLVAGTGLATAITSLGDLAVPFFIFFVVGTLFWVLAAANLQSKEEGYRTVLLDMLRTPLADSTPPAEVAAPPPTSSGTRQELSFRSAAAFLFSGSTAMALGMKLAEVAFLRLTFGADEIAAKHLHIAWQGRQPVLSDGRHLSDGQDFFFFLLFSATWIALTFAIMAIVAILRWLFSRVRTRLRPTE